MLPFFRLSPADFESLCRRVFTLYVGRPCKKYGDSGERQDGIDAFIEWEDREPWAYQFKRQKRFGPSEVTQAVEKARTFCASKYHLVTACELTTAARRKLPREPEWEGIQGSDLCELIGTLGRRDASELLDRFFGVQARAEFFGRTLLTSYEDPWNFFEPDRFGLASHGHPLIGNVSEIDQLARSLTTGTPEPLIVVGPPGIGKSRTLFELATRVLTNSDFVVCATGDRDLLAGIDSIPEGSGVIVVDDAERGSESLRALARFCVSNGHKLVLSCRTEGRALVRGALADATRHTPSLEHTLERLSSEDSAKLASEILPTKYEIYAATIAQQSGGLPLEIVLASVALRDHRLHPRQLANDESFRSNISARFGCGELSLDEEVLTECIALLQPVQPDIAGRLATEFWSVERRAAERAVDSLLRRGVVRRRGRLLQLAVDALRDSFLDSYLRRQSSQDELRSMYIRSRGDVQLANHVPQLVANLAYAEWRNTKSASAEVELPFLWRDIIQDASSRRGVARVDILRPVASLLPHFLISRLETLATEVDSDKEELSQLLGLAAWNPSVSAQAIAVLLGLAAEGIGAAREQIVELCKYKPQVSIAVPKRVLAALEQRRGDDRLTSLQVEVGNSLLTTVARDAYSQGARIVTTRALVSYERTADVRARSLRLLRNAGRSRVDSVRKHAYAALADAARPIFGHRVDPPPDIIAWHGWQQAIAVQALFVFAAAEQNPALRAYIATQLREVASIQAESTNVVAVLDLVGSIAAQPAVGLAWVVTNDSLWLTSLDRSESWQQRVAFTHAKRVKILRTFVSEHPDYTDRMESIEGLLQYCEDHELAKGQAGRMLPRSMTEVDLDWVADVPGQLISAPTRYPRLLQLLPQFWWELASTRRLDLRATWKLVAGSEPLRRLFGAFLGNDRQTPRTNAVVFRDVVIELLDGDATDVGHGISALARLAEVDRGMVHEMLAELSLNRSERLAKQLCEEFGKGTSLEVDDLDSDVLTHLLAELQRVPVLGGYWVAEFLNAVVTSDPERFINWLLGRIPLKRTWDPKDGDRRWFEPTPDFATSTFFGIRDPEVRRKALTEIAELSRRSERELDEYAQVYDLVAGCHDDTSIEILACHLKNPTSEDLLRIAALFAGGPTVRGRQVDRLFTHEGFVVELLDLADQLGCSERVFRKLMALSDSFWSSVVGEADTYWVRIANSSEEAARRHPPCSATARFFEGLAEKVRREIESHLIHDAERFDL